MKPFTTVEIRDLYNRFFREEISFTRMVEIMNERVSERVNEFKDGDFLVKEHKDGVQYIFILDYIDDKGLIYYHCYYGNRFNTTCVKDDFGIGAIGDSRHKRLRYATDSEKELLIAELYKVGKRWNEEKLCIEDIPARKFKKGDKVRIKHGVSSKTHCNIKPEFLVEMDDLIGKTMTVSRYTNLKNYVKCEGMSWSFSEEWLEPYEGLKEGDLAIFWDINKSCAFIGKYNGSPFTHQDHRGYIWGNAIKFESKEQFERLIKGEI